MRGEKGEDEKENNEYVGRMGGEEIRKRIMSLEKG